MTIIPRTPLGARSGRRLPPVPCPRNPARVGLIALLVLLVIGTPSRGQEKSPIPPFDGRRHVYVGEGVPGDYRSLEDQIARLEKGSTPSTHYYVVVVRSSGRPTGQETRAFANEVARTWKSRAAAGRAPLDEGRSVIVVVAVENHQVAVHPGAALAELGLSGERIDREVVGPSQFLKLAHDHRYPEAISALLNTTDEWIAGHDASVRRTAGAEKTATPAPATAPPPARSAPVTEGQPGVAVVTPAVSNTSFGHSLAIGLGLSLAVIVAAILGGILMFHRRTKGRLDQKVKAFRSRATDVMDRLDALKERLKLLPSTDPDFQNPMAGETAALYTRVQESVGALWDRWLQIMDTVERAQKLSLGVTSPFKRKALHEAEALIEKKGVFEEIDTGTQACSAEMDRLNQAHEAARGELEAVSSARPKLDAQLEAVRKLGLPIAPYQEELTAIAAETDQAREQLVADPIGARKVLEGLRSRGEAMNARVDRVAGLLQEAKNTASALEALKRQVAEHRSKGLRLDEEGGNPDEPMAQAARAHASASSALESGDLDAAAKELESARALVERAKSTVEEVRAAREYCRREQSERLRATERLRAALPHAEDSFHRLDREFAPASWEAVRPNVDQVHELLASFDRATADAAADSSDDAQRYLAGARALRQLAQQQQNALRLMSGIGDKLNALSAIRDDCRRRRGELDATGRRVEGFFRQNDPLVGTMALDILDQARRGRDAVLDAFDRHRPDWPSLKDGLAKALEGFKVAQDQAEVDVRSHAQLADEYERARNELERVADLLAGRREDRMAANQRFRSAAEVLDRVGLDLSQPQGEWPRLLEQVQGAVADLEQSERLAREDIRLAAQAQSEIEEAIRSIEQSRGYYAMGVGADTSSAEAAVARAEQLLGSQQYEQAIQSAGQAQQAARRAHQDAVQQASWRQMRADSERRRWEGGGSSMGDALATGAAVAAGVILGNAMEGSAEAAPAPPPDMPEPVISPEPPPNDTSVSSWEDDTGQSSW